jgi:hypothetical protein
LGAAQSLPLMPETGDKASLASTPRPVPAPLRMMKGNLRWA